MRENARRGYNLWYSDWDQKGTEFGGHIGGDYGDEVRYLAHEVTSFDERSLLIKTFNAQDTFFSGLINAAGRDYERSFNNLSSKQVLKLTRLMVVANIDLNHAFLELLDYSRRIKLINICCLAAYFPIPYKAINFSFKRFFLQFSLALRQEIKDFGSVTFLCSSGMPTAAESKRKIRASSFWCLFTAQDPQRVAYRTIDFALNGNAVYIRGFLKQALTYLEAVVAVELVTGYVTERWNLVPTVHPGDKKGQ